MSWTAINGDQIPEKGLQSVTLTDGTKKISRAYTITGSTTIESFQAMVRADTAQLDALDAIKVLAPAGTPIDLTPPPAPKENPEQVAYFAAKARIQELDTLVKAGVTVDAAKLSAAKTAAADTFNALEAKV